MKRYGGLFETVVTYENLARAFTQARRGCGWNGETRRFFFRLEPELLTLQQELIEGRYRPGGYRYFAIQDPKPRTIAVAPFRDRVVHHAVVNVLTPLYERVFIEDSYATRVGKGTHRAILRAQRLTRRWPWYLKMDVAKYFDSVDHDVLLTRLRRKLKDPPLLALLARVITPTQTPGKGLPIGNLTSQFLANVYLDPFDHYVKETLRVRGYLRYMDDFILFAEARPSLKHHQAKVERFLAESLRLSPKPGGTWLNRSRHGVSFLGMRVFPHYLRMIPANRQRTLRRIRERLSDWEAGQVDEARMAQSLASLQGHLTYFTTSRPVC
jgi:RNA-directed DNA polymerase